MKQVFLFISILVTVTNIFAYQDFLKGREVQLTAEQKEAYYKKVREDPEANSFNPLHVGDKWWFSRSWNYPPEEDSFIGRTIVASAYVDNEEYFFASAFTSTRPTSWLRNIGDTTVVLDSLDSDNNPETSFLIDEDFTITEYNPDYAPYVWTTTASYSWPYYDTIYRCYLLWQGFFEQFGVVTELKMYHYYAEEYADWQHDIIWARGFGLIYASNEWCQIGAVGCIIDNVAYGMTPIEETTTVKINEIEISTYPNPARYNVQIEYKLPDNSIDSTIEIFNIKGQLVQNKRITNSGNFNWNTTDNKGKPVTSGIYFVKIKTDKYQSIQKMLLIK
jgi:hypothetical protein